MVIDLIGFSQEWELQHKEDLVSGGGIVTRYVIPLIPWPLTSFGVASLTFAGGRRVFFSPLLSSSFRQVSVEPREDE